MVGSFVCPIFLHSLRGVAELTRSLRSLVRSRLSQLVKKNRPHSPTMKTFCCVVSLSIFTSCAVFWRARRASQNTNNE